MGPNTENPSFTSFPFLVNTTLAIEKLRIAAEVRQTHLKNNKREDPETDALFERINNLEEYVDERIGKLLSLHPAYPWFSRVKGIGKENIAKIVGLVDINKAQTISALWKYAGFHVQDGHAPHPIPGQKLEYNKQLRSMCWRVAGSLMKAGGHGGKFYQYYLQQKERLTKRYELEGKKIVPADELPKEKGKSFEPPDMISEIHVHNQALRKMIKLFLSCLWIAWREAEGLPIREPYVHEYKGHTKIVRPEDMVDRPLKMPRRKKAE